MLIRQANEDDLPDVLELLKGMDGEGGKYDHMSGL